MKIPALTPAWSSLRHSLQKMKLHRCRMLQDLSRKQEALSLERRSASARRSLTSARPPGGASGDAASADRLRREEEPRSRLAQ